MTNTRSSKIDFGNKAYVEATCVVKNCTYGSAIVKTESIKIIKKGSNKGEIFGCRKVDIKEQRLQETHRKINKMLGGN